MGCFRAMLAGRGTDHELMQLQICEKDEFVPVAVPAPRVLWS